MKTVFLLLLGAMLVALPSRRVLVAAEAARPVEAGVASDLAMLRASAERGDALAQYDLGIAYAEGRHGPANPVEALVWLTLAAERGTTARELGLLLVSLSTEQIAAAGRRLEAIRANNPNLRSTAMAGAAKSSPAIKPPSPVVGPPAQTRAKADEAEGRTPGSGAWDQGLSSTGDDRSAVEVAAPVAGSQTRTGETRAPASTQSDSALNSLGNQVSILERDLRSATTALTRVAAEKAAAETKLAAANQQLADALKKSKSPRRHDADSSWTLSAGAEQRIAELQSDLSDTRSRLTGAEKQIAARDEELRTLRAAVTGADSRASLASGEVEMARRASDEARRGLADMTRELTQARKEVAAARERETRLVQLEAGKRTLLNRPVEPGISQEEFARVTAAQVAAEGKLSVALRSYALMTRERDELRAQTSAARELESQLRQLESNLRQLESEKTRLHDADPYVSKAEYSRVVAAQADAENKLATTLRAFTLIMKERDELRARIADRSKVAFTAGREEAAAPR